VDGPGAGGLPAPSDASPASSPSGAATVVGEWLTRLWRRWAEPEHRPVLIGLAITAALMVGYLAVPRMGGDLSAQMARADFAGDHPFSAIDFRWFGGTLQFNYSLWSPLAMAVLGVKLTGAVATVAAVGLLTRLIVKAKAPHPLFGAIAASVTLTTNLVEGRVTFTQGIACGLAALLAISEPTRRRRVLAVAFALLSAGASPVAALFLMLCAGVLLLDRRLLDAILLGVGAALPTLLTSFYFTDAGRQIFGAREASAAIEISLLVVVLVRNRRIRIGGLLGALMVFLALVISSPVGSNSVRLTTLFALPILLAWLPNLGFARGRLRITAEVAVAVALVYLIQPSISFGTIGGTGRPATYAGYYQPLVRELNRLGPLTGRVEVPELTGHWEAAYLAREVPLARGWLRQLDTKLNDDVTYHPAAKDKTPNAAEYRMFLRRNAVQYVAVPDARPTYYGYHERLLIEQHPPYLTEVWSNEHWTLYAVKEFTPIVSAPGQLVRYEADRIVITVTQPGDVTVRIRWLRFLTLSGPDGACLAGADQTVVIRHARPGHYTIGSGLPAGSRHC
jgi:hypothetical protein